MIKSTGIIRRMDELGRVVIPIEIRNQFNIAEKDPMEIYVDGSSFISFGTFIGLESFVASYSALS